VPVGVLVPWSGSKAIEATLLATLTRSLFASATPLTVRAPPPHTAPVSAPQPQSAGAPLWTIQQLAPVPVKRLRRRGWLRAIASLRASWMSAARRGAALSSRRASISAVNDGAAVAATIAVIATTIASSRSVSPC